LAGLPQPAAAGAASDDRGRAGSGEGDTAGCRSGRDPVQVPGPGPSGRPPVRRRPGAGAARAGEAVAGNCGTQRWRRGGSRSRRSSSQRSPVGRGVW
jgi:hypothetical protein